VNGLIFTCALMFIGALGLSVLLALWIDVLITALRDNRARRSGRPCPQKTWLQGGRW